MDLVLLRLPARGNPHGQPRPARPRILTKDPERDTLTRSVGPGRGPASRAVETVLLRTDEWTWLGEMTQQLQEPQNRRFFTCFKYNPWKLVPRGFRSPDPMPETLVLLRATLCRASADLQRPTGWRPPHFHEQCVRSLILCQASDCLAGFVLSHSGQGRPFLCVSGLNCKLRP